MATGKVVGQIQVTQGNIKVIGVDGAVREPGYEGYVYENEQVISNDPSALFQIKFLALPESSAYDGIFRILADGSVIHGRDAMDSMMSDESLVKVLETASVEDAKTAGEDIGDLETAAGEEGAEGSSSFTETDIVAESSVLGFSRGANGALGFGITDFGSVPNYDAGQITPPAITSPNVVIYDENDTIPVIQITATAEGSVTYSIGGLDSGFFDIDSATGLVTFKESPDFENPRDSGGDNEYNTYVTVTDTYGNYTTQLLSVSINNVNEPVTAEDDVVSAVEDTILSSAIDLDANDYDVDGDALSVVGGTYTTAQGGTIVIAENGSYTYTPKLNFNGTDSVNYTVTDGEFEDTGTLTITVAPANDAPYTDDVSASGAEDVASIAITLTGNDDDDNGTVESFQLQGLPQNGTLYTDAGLTTLAAAGTNYPASSEALTLYFVPNENWNGESTFDYVAIDDDGAADASAATATITVAPANDAPYTDDVSASGAEDVASIAITLTGNDDDDNGTVESFQLQGLPQNGTLYTDAGLTTLAAAGTNYPASSEALTLYFVPNENWNGESTFDYVAIDDDGAADASAATATITVNPVADAPLVTVIPDLIPEIDQDYKNETFTNYDWQINSGSSTGILEFDGYARSVSMNIKSFNGNPGFDTGIVELLRDGVVVETYSLNDFLTTNPGASAKIPLTFTSDAYFNEVRVNNTSVSGDVNNEFKILNVMLVSPYLVTYSVEASAVLTDNSETLSNLILKVPSSLDGLLVVDGFAPNAILSADGEFNYYSVPAENGGVELIFDFSIEPTAEELSALGDAIADIIGGATSWESGDGFALSATSGDDVIVGTSEDNDISGEEGSDVIFGGAGADDVDGDAGNDTLSGEEGDDYIDGGAGADALYGGAGNDTIVYDIADTKIDGGDGADKLIVNSGDIDFSNVSNIEEIDLSSGDYTLSNITLVDVLDITDGNNVLKITGDSGDGVDNLADNGWVLDSSPAVTESGYATYTNIADSSVQLLIDEDIIIITD